jgi:hypothetical protein
MVSEDDSKKSVFCPDTNNIRIFALSDGTLSYILTFVVVGDVDVSSIYTKS